MAGHRQTLIQIPVLPRGQPPMDLLHFRIGDFVFLVVTELSVDKDGDFSRVFRMLDREPWTIDPEPILTLPTFHPRNIAVGPEINGARWIWIADHGVDIPPYPGASSLLYRIHEDGSVERHNDPLLCEKNFSFDAAIWANPINGEHWLYQSNIGNTKVRLFKWDGEFGRISDFTNLLPEVLCETKRKFLVSRIISVNTNGVSLYMGADTSDTQMRGYESDAILDFCYDGYIAFRTGTPVPPRLKDPSWSTVEVEMESFDQGANSDLLVLSHDHDFREGKAEILWRTPDGRFERSGSPLPIPSLFGEETWIARAAIGDVDRDGMMDVVLYLRPTVTWKNKPLNNVLVFRNCGNRRFENVSEEFSPGAGYFVGGFFGGVDRSNWIQLSSEGNIEVIRFKESNLKRALEPSP